VPYRNFVTSISETYQPLIFKSTKMINNLLKNNILINQTVTPLSDGAIELLCLGLNFIPSREDEPISQQPICRLITSINQAIFFSQQKKQDYTRGWLHHYTTSEWSPPPQSWLQDETIIKLLTTLPTAGIKSSSIPHKLNQELLNLQKRQDIHILKSDKGRNTVLWRIEDYDREGIRQLGDKGTYHELSKLEFDTKLLSIQKQCHELSENLLSLKLISSTEDNCIRQRPPTGSAIYFLPKIHKDEQKSSKTFPGRPIVATYSSVTYLLDKYITEITSHLLPLIPGSLIDTQDFLKKLPKGPLPPTSTLLTADVTSLYPNIPWEEGIHASTEFYHNNLDFLKQTAALHHLRPPPHASLFKQILTLILTNSMIHFKDKRFFHQIKGTAMGCCISVYFANSYMYFITRNLILSPPSWLICFLRFIDDLFFITTEYDESIFTSTISTISNSNIRYEFSKPDRTQNFLDTTTTITKKNIITTEPYSKETASGSYLHPSSMHPSHTVKATPYSQILRIRRISSNKYLFRKHFRKLRTDFTNMGYPIDLIDHYFKKVFSKSDSELASKKDRTAISNSFKFITNFNSSRDWNLVQKILNNLHKTIIQHYRNNGPYQNKQLPIFLKSKPIRIIHSNGPNLSSHFTKNLKHSH